MTETADQLLHKYFEGTLTPDEAAALNVWVEASDDNARQCARAMLEFHLTRELFVGRNVATLMSESETPLAPNDGVLAEALALEAEANRRRKAIKTQSELDEQASADARREGMSFLLGQVDPVVPVRHIVIPRAVVVALVAALVAVVIVLAWPDEQPIVEGERDIYVAQLAEAVDARWEGASPALGESLTADRYHLTQGFARIAFIDGASVVIEAPARFRLDSESSMRLESGRLVGHCPTVDSRGFTVRTPDARVVDVGTEFGVEVQEHGATTVAVFQGEVVLRENKESGNESRDVSLTHGVAIKVADGKVASDPFSVDEHTSFIRSIADARFVPVVTPQVRFMRTAPVSVEPGQLSNDDHAVLFLERRHVMLPRQVGVRLATPGVATSFGEADQSALAAGKRVDSYYLHFEKQGPGLHAIEGTIRFPRRIVGVVASTRSMLQTHDMLGLPEVRYDTAADSRSGLEGLESTQTSQPDRIEIDPDGRTLHLRLTVQGSADDIRILIESDGP